MWLILQPLSRANTGLARGREPTSPPGSSAPRPNFRRPNAARRQQSVNGSWQMALPPGRMTTSGNEATLLDDELETLFSRFQKKQIDLAKEKGENSHQKWIEEEEKSRRLRREEMKVRALNRNGRIDYSIQE